jgi:hypothetical protein
MASHYENPAISDPPMPSDPLDARRCDHTRLRRRMLYGQWRPDLESRFRKAMGNTRAAAIGEPDLSANPFAATCQATAALYDRAPRISHPAGQDVTDTMRTVVTRAGLWAQMQRTMRDVLGLREMLVRVDARRPTEDGPVEVVYRPVPPDLVQAIPDPERPERPIEVREARMRKSTTSGIPRWTWEVWSLAGDIPRHYILAAESMSGHAAGEDVSHLFGLPEGGASGDAYPCHRNGVPALPYVTYHAARTGCLFDPWHGCEVVEGTLNVGVMWTFFAHCVRNASWPQRWMLDAEPAGANLEGDPGTERLAVVADPAVALPLRKSGDSDTQPQVGQWANASDPKALAEALGVYERRLAAYAGLDPSDVQRTSGDPRSGYAIAISREGRREAQRRYAPVFAPADEELLGLTAAVVNATMGTPGALPEDGWVVEYESLPPSPDELEGQRTHVLALLEAGIIDQPKALHMLGLPDEDVEDGSTEEADTPAAQPGDNAPAQPLPVDANAASVADTALNGAQVKSLLEVITAVATGQLPRSSAVGIIEVAFRVTPAQAEKMLGDVGRSFFAPSPDDLPPSA